MGVNYPLWFAGSIVFLIGIVGLLLTHFGIVAGFRWITPIIWGVATTLYFAALPFPKPYWSFPLIWFISFVLFLEVLYYNWLGLSTVISLFPAGWG